METSRSTSRERSSISFEDMSECARQASRIWAATVRTGFRAFIALCMTTENSRQRMGRSSRSDMATMSRSWNTTSPPMMSPLRGGPSRRAMA